MPRPKANEAQTATRFVQYVPLAELRRAPRNPNGHDLPGLASSIRRHGFVEPVVVDGRTSFLVGGHGRLDVLEAMRESGEIAPEGVDVNDDGVWLVPAIFGWESKSDEDAEAMLLAMMRLPRSGGINDEVLAEMLASLAEGGEDALDGTGYTMDDLDDLMAGLDEDVYEEQGFGTGELAAPEPTMGDRADNYANKQVRSMVLDFPVADYMAVVEKAQAARTFYGVESNAELFQAMLMALELPTEAE